MDIIVAFVKTVSNELKNCISGLGGEIQSIASQVFGEDKNCIKVQFAAATLKSIPEDAKIAILVYYDKGANNFGQRILDFKQRILETFKDHGVTLDKQFLTVKFIPNSEAKKIIPDTDKENKSANQKHGEIDEFDYEQKSKQYIPTEPLYSFERVILPTETVEKIQEAIGILLCENKVFKEWGLYEIQPHPSTALSFFGPSGTGKTMAAEAVAHKLGKKILKVSYADVESKYHGEGPKMVKAIFLAAKNTDSVLFFDEADSLLSKRLTNVSQGSEQAINSMRSQLLICLEEFRGIVIFATNLVVNYDQAFLTRLISVEFKLPDVQTRKTIWDVHTKAPNDGAEHQLRIPLANDVDTLALAEKYEFVGREIRNAVVSACVSTVLNERDIVTQNDFINACEKIVKEQTSLAQAKDHTQSSKLDIIKEAVKNKLKKTEEESEDVSE